MGISGAGASGQSDFIKQMLFLESAPLRRLESRRADLDARFGVMTDLRTRVNTLKSLLADFAAIGSGSALRKFQVASSNESIMTASASAVADVGGHTIKVSQLAQAHALAATELVGSGSDIAAGTYDFDVTVDGTTTSISVTIASGDDNDAALKKIRDSIRNSGAEVFANVLTTDTTAGTRKLVLTAKETGEAAMVSQIADTSGGLMTQLGLAGSYNPNEVAGATTVAAQDATFTLDGVQVSSASNEVEGVLEGVVLSLKDDTDPTTTVNFTVEHDKEAVKEKLNALIDAFNEVQTYLNSKLASGDETGAGRGELAGSLTFSTFRNGLKTLMASAMDSAYVIDGVNTIDDIGLSMSRDGKLSLSDEEAFFNALTSKSDGVEAFFSSDGGFAARLEDVVKAFTKSGGALDLEEDLVDSRRDVLDMRIERMESFLAVREEQLRDQIGRLSQFVARISAQQSVLGTLGMGSFFGF